MNVQAVRTKKVQAGDNLFEILDESIVDLKEASVVAVTSKIVSLCESRVVPLNAASKEELIEQEADLFLPKEFSNYGHKFSIIKNTLIASAGIDESNGGDYFVLWPDDAQKSANEIREYLKKRFSLDRVGVIITDSTSQPLRRGTYGIRLAHSGFRALNNYIGKPDLFGRPFHVSKSNISSGLAAASVVAMGEGSEQTPLAIISDISFVEFQDRNPNKEELAELTISLEEDLFAPFLKSVNWQKGLKNQ